MNHLRDLLRSAARFPRAGLDAAVLAQRATRRRRRRATVVASTSAVAIALLVLAVGVAAGTGQRARPHVEIAGSPEDTTSSGNESTLPDRATSVPGSTATSSGTPTTAVPTPATVEVPGPMPHTTSPDATEFTTTSEPTPTSVPRPISRAGVVGSVTAGPTCPVEPAPDGCPPSPVAKTAVQALDSSGKVVGSDRTDSNGNFGITLATGAYTLHVVTSGPFPTCEDVPVRVTSDGATRADVHCDTGIR